MSVLRGIDVQPASQHPLQPQTIASPTGADLAFRIEPIAAHPVDFIDAVHVDTQRTLYVFGDVVPAESTHMQGRGLLSAALRSLTLHFVSSSDNRAQGLRLLNDFLHDEMTDNSFCTVSLVEFDAAAGTVTHTGAGHQGFHISADGSLKRRLESSGLPIGLFPASEYRSGPAEPFVAGDVIVLLSDGFTQAVSESAHLYGTERVLTVCRAHAGRSAGELLEGLFEDVTEFTGPANRHEDLAGLVLRAEG